MPALAVCQTKALVAPASRRALPTAVHATRVIHPTAALSRTVSSRARAARRAFATLMAQFSAMGSALLFMGDALEDKIASLVSMAAGAAGATAARATQAVGEARARERGRATARHPAVAVRPARAPAATA